MFVGEYYRHPFTSSWHCRSQVNNVLISCISNINPQKNGHSHKFVCFIFGSANFMKDSVCTIRGWWRTGGALLTLAVLCRSADTDQILF